MAALVLSACSGATEPEPDLDEKQRPILEEEYDCRAQDRLPASRGRFSCFLTADCGAPLVVGHRGVGGNLALYAPENTLSAVRLAIRLGVDGVEIDVRHTADDELIVIHDSTTDRTTEASLSVGTITASQALALAVRTEGYPGQLDCERVPSFVEVLEIARDRIFLVVDTKTSRADLVARVIEEAGMLDQAVVSVSDIEKAVLARRTVPEVAVQIRPDSLVEYEEQRSRLERAPEIIEVPGDVLDDFRPLADEVGARLFTNLFIEDVMVFGDGRLDHYGPAFQAGADIAQTEFPMWLLEHLGRKSWTALPRARDVGLCSPRLFEQCPP